MLRGVLPFWISILALSLGQGLTVALPGVLRVPFVSRLHSRWWATIPAVSVVAFVFLVRAVDESAEGLTYLALVAVPLLAVLALAWLAYRPRPLLGLLVAPLFGLAWLDPTGLAGQAASVILTALSCVSLGVLLASVTPPRWLAAGIIAMAIADTALVVSDLLQTPNSVLNAVHPVANLPRLQSASFGSAVMGYGDFFVAAALGALLARRDRALQVRGTLLAMLLASLFDLLFFAVSELPATVPIAFTLILLVLWPRTRALRPLKRGAALAREAEGARAGPPRSGLPEAGAAGE
jgi:hypothetical protein